ncbi:uncharacterized protein TM35_000771150 [Trypanosoma theileri]|uniref:Surface protein TolT n=1 Tax=Trypanosoma theileri TaxID=67003 RepID=A0A1X0NF10_9TRYP|nr:uncharacterized protein TM35_000771150 [Trypanosoma theileri]ORC83153.1 hypothetical protein TM35_000771150 [Trypanosoma theileri]
MSMLSCRVLCLLAIVLCCVGVAHADPALPSQLVEEAKTLAEETSKLKVECDNAAKAARQAANEAFVFAHVTKTNLVTIAADPNEVEKTKSEGLKFIENTTKAAEEAERVRDETITSKDKAEEAIFLVFPDAVDDETVPEEIAPSMNAVKDAERAISTANDDIGAAKLHAEEVKNVLQQLDAAVAAAKEREKEKQVESQPQPQEQRNETSLPPTNATITNGTKRNDGSSSPALLRVPLLLLLLSVLSCMAVC